MISVRDLISIYLRPSKNFMKDLREGQKYSISPELAYAYLGLDMAMDVLDRVSSADMLDPDLRQNFILQLLLSDITFFYNGYASDRGGVDVETFPVSFDYGTVLHNGVHHTSLTLCGIPGSHMGRESYMAPDMTDIAEHGDYTLTMSNRDFAHIAFRVNRRLKTLYRQIGGAINLWEYGQVCRKFAERYMPVLNGNAFLPVFKMISYLALVNLGHDQVFVKGRANVRKVSIDTDVVLKMHAVIFSSSDGFKFPLYEDFSHLIVDAR